MSAQSASGPHLAGEEGGPNYEQLPRGQLPPGVLFGDAQVNGVPPRTSQTTSVDEVSAATAVGTADGGIPMTQADGSQLDPPLLPHATGREVSDAAGPASLPATAEQGMREVQGGVSPAPGQASTGPQMNRGGALLFPPSPLPGASPVNDRPFEAVTSRAATWVQRLGEMFQQRRVEVHTSWSQSPSRSTGGNPWNGQEPFINTGFADQEAAREMNHTPPSTGSATVPYELVQAEVARQLDGVASEMYRGLMERLEQERVRTEAAEQQAQALRQQLVQVEMQAQALRDGTLGMDAPTITTSMPIRSTNDVQDLVSPPGLLPQGEPPREYASTTGAKTSMLRLPGMAWAPAPKTMPSSNPHLSDALPRSGPVPPSTGPMSSGQATTEEGLGKRFLQGLFGYGGSNGQGGASFPQRGATSRTDTATPVAPTAIAPPPAPNVASTNLAGSDQVLSAMAKGIESLLMNQGARADRPETVKPGITELPTLPAYTPETGSIDLINWITHITPIMEDLSDSSSVWWSDTLKEVMLWYSKYSVATPLERIQLLPVVTSAPNKAEWARVERRATAMMLTAIPATLKEEVIAAGGVNTLNLLAKLFSTYQPGNRQEKALVLANLERPGECQDAATAVEALRKWALWRRRATAIGITEPDSSVLLQGLDRICSAVVRADPELAFRVSLIRSTLQVDVNPTAASVTKFFQHLQAELEQQARLGAAKGPEMNPRLKALGPYSEGAQQPATTTPSPPPGAKASGNQCKFFLSEKGCRRGKDCRYPHQWSAFDKAEKSRRCLVCGAVGHKSKECRAAGGGLASRPKDAAKAPPPKEASASPSSAPSSTSSSPARKVGFDGVSDAVVKALSVLKEVKKIDGLASLASTVDKWVKKWGGTDDSRPALLDSGATHPLRRPRDHLEWENAMNVSVALAGDTTTTMKQTLSGTLLSGDELTQVIVPLGRVISNLGYRLRWTATECCLERNGDDTIPLQVVRGCPEVDEQTAQRLIDELEQCQVPRLKEATLDSVRILRDVEVSWWSCLVEYVDTGNVQAGLDSLLRASFFDDADREDLRKLLLRYPNDGGWQSMKDLGLNRRTRKRLMNASTWIVRWGPPGFARKSDLLQKVGRMSEVAYLNVNSMMARGDILTTWKVLLWAASTGRIGAFLTRDSAPTPAEYAAHGVHRARVHLLHALASAGQYRRGCAVPRFLVESRRGTMPETLHWMNDGKAQRYCDEMDICSPMYVEDEAVELVSGLTGVVYDKGFGRVRMARMSQDAAWRLHVMRNHQPFRRDCALCVRNAATGRQHRATLHPSGYTLSVDVAGPLKGYGRSPDGKFFRYFVIGAFRIPLLDGGVGRDGCVHGHPIPEGHIAEDEDVLSEEEEDPEALEEETEGPSAKDIEKEREEWRKLKASFREPLMSETLYFCVPVNSKKAIHVLPALQQMVIDVRALGYPVVRVHSDRGGELRGNAVKRWVLNQGILRTTSTGSEPAENGAAEAGVRFLKRRARILLDAAGLTREHWPTAVQTAALQQRCEKLGIPSPTPVAYGAKVYVKTKKYKTGDVESMKPHWMQGKYLGPSTDVRGGHVILKSTGTFLTTTHVRVAREPPRLEDVAPPILVDCEDPPPLPAPADPPEAAPEHPGDKPRVELPSSSGRGPYRSEASDALPPYPTGPPITYSPPGTRVRGKSPGVRMKALRAGDYEDMYEQMVDAGDDADPSYSQEEIMMRVLKAQEKQAVEAVARELLAAGDFSKEACQRLLRSLGGFHTRWRTPRTAAGQGMVLGAYVRGGSFGITKHGREMPYTMRFLNKFLLIRLQYTMPGSTSTWTTLAMQRANEIPAHRDVHNQRGTRNYVMEIADESLEGLWVEGTEGAPQVEGGDGQSYPHEYQTPDGHVHQGRVHSIDEPVAFDPRARHAMVHEPGMKWVLSAYTPSGVQSLLQADVDYLFVNGFPVTGTGVSLPTVRAIQRVSYGHGAPWETTPEEVDPSLLPQFVPWSGAQGAGAQEEVEPSDYGDDVDEAEGDWELFVEDSEESCVMEQGSEPEDEPLPRLRALCSAMDPGPERELLYRCYEGHLERKDCEPTVQEEMAVNLEEWETVLPKMAKVEPEFTEDIETLISGLSEPLRHTHNVNPRDVRATMERWRKAIEKELKVIEKGFNRVDVEELRKLKKSHQVQELPAKLVYTLKPPAEDAVPGTEEAKCKRKARIVCCGNFNDQDPGEVFASGAAAESLRCALTLAALRKWAAGGLDIGGAFMLTPLPQDKVLFSITPPAILIQLGLATATERWILTRAMYGLRQAPRLWSEFRDEVVKKMRVHCDGVEWEFRQGTAEPNIWMLFQVGQNGEQQPGGVLLIYVDDLLLLGPQPLVEAMAATIQSTWKTSSLEIVISGRGIRFLGCEIESNEGRDTYWIHQRPYIAEILRHHDVKVTSRSPIPCAKELFTLQVEDQEPRGGEEDIKQAQKLCGELLWLSQRSRPDIAFPVSIMGSLITKAAPRSVEIGVRLLSYLQRSADYALQLRPVEGGYAAWSDCSFAPNGTRSHSGMVITWEGAVVGWRSGRQPFISLSTAEGELVAGIETLTLAMSMKAIIDQFGVDLPITTLYIDNQATLALASHTTSVSWRTRHLRLRAAFLQERVDAGNLQLKFVPGRLQLADLLTKGFPRQRLEELCGLWGLVDVSVAIAQKMLVKMMVVLTMMVQSARGAIIEKEPLPLETSWELCIMLVLLGVAVIACWECGWSIWYSVTGQETPAQTRRAKRMKKMQDAIKEEIQAQLASSPMSSTPASVGEAASSSSRPSSSTDHPVNIPPPPAPHETTRPTSTAWRPTGLQRGKTVYQANQKDKACQTEGWMIPSPRPLIQYVDREVPVPIAEPTGWTRPLWVAEGGDHFHTLDYCWGLRHSRRTRRLLYCTVCRDNFGKNKYPERASGSGG